MQPTTHLSPACAAFALTFTVWLAGGGGLAAQDPARAGRLDAMRRLGLDATIAIYPIDLLQQPNRDVGDTLGLLLEKRGMAALVPSETAFAPANGSDWAATVAAFATHVRQHPEAAAYALYASITGTPDSGPQAIRFVVVDAAGEIVLEESRTPADPEFRRALGKHAEPMTCCVFLRDRLAETLALPAARSTDAPGRFARLWGEKSGLPEQPERDAMQRRLDEMRKQRTSARFAVLPTRLGQTLDDASAQRLAAALTESAQAHAEASRPGARIEVAASNNEQKRLWDFARGLRAHLRQHPVDADYVIMADYGIDAERGERGYVHVVVCDRQGEWVAVDWQNSHHADYRSVAPKTTADSDRVASGRVKMLLR